MQLDVLKELFNIGVGRAAGVLNQMMNKHILLEVPQLHLVSEDEVSEEWSKLRGATVSAVKLSFDGAFSGTAVLMFMPGRDTELVASLTGEPLGSADLEMIRPEALSEVGNIILNSVMGAMVNVLQQRLQFGISYYVEDRLESLVALEQAGAMENAILAQARLMTADSGVLGDVCVVFDPRKFGKLLAEIDRKIEEIAG